MKHIVTYFTALVLLCCVSCEQKKTTPQNSSGKPAARTAAKSTLQKSYFLKHDFGVVDEGQTFKCSLELKNDTDKPMTFAHSSTAGPEIAGKKLGVLGLGAIGVFELEFNTNGKRGATPQNAYFWDAEPKTLLVAADINATVRSIWADPGTIGLGNLSTSEPHQTKLYVMAAGLSDAKVLSMRCDSPWLNVTSKPVDTSPQLLSQNIKAIDYYEIEWTGKEAKPGNLSANIAVTVQKGEEEQTLEIPVSGYLSGDVEIVPSQIVFGRVAKDEIVRTCKLAFKNRPDVAKIQCAAEHESIKVVLSELDGDLVVTATLVPPSEKSNGLLEGTIVGKDEAGKILFSIPYIAFLDSAQ